VQNPESAHQNPAGQVPQVPPQPLSPHCFAEQSGSHPGTHIPSALQESLAGQVPQLPPQPSSPHCFEVQSGAQSP
jgi:hypothetical protein